MLETPTVPSAFPYRQGLALIATASLVAALAAALECHGVVAGSAPEAPFLPSMLYGIVLWGWWGIAAAALWTQAHRGSAPLLSWRGGLPHAFIGPVLAAAHAWVLQQTVEWLAARWTILGPAGYNGLQYLTWNRFFSELLIYAFAFAVAGLAQLKLASQREQLRALSLEKELAAAHLRALEMQIEPHFLFNALNAVASLVELGRGKEAVFTLERLNAILRRTLSAGGAARVKLAHELETLDDYLAIEQTRFADRLGVSMEIDPEALAADVPSFLLQPLIENAVRHGIARLEQGGQIAVAAQRCGQRLRLMVRNSCAAEAERANGHGIGLRNTRERLAYFYPGQCTFDARRRGDETFAVEIEIPFERGEAR